MFVSVFELFKIGVGPSSSHTMGPTIAAGRFIKAAGSIAKLSKDTHKLSITLFGSLAHTGVGHGTPKAVMAGLLGFSPDQDFEKVVNAINALQARQTLDFANGPGVRFDPEHAFVFDKINRNQLHPNSLTFEITDMDGSLVFSETYCSVGGGFVLSEEEMATAEKGVSNEEDVPYPFHSADEMLEMGDRSGLNIAQMKRANEATKMSNHEIDAGLNKLWLTMQACIKRGLSTGGELPGGLHVKRRAMDMHDALRSRGGDNAVPLHSAIDWLSAYAMAVNEENAAGGQVVTAPTNGAAGVLPAVICYYLDHVPDADPGLVPTMLLTASAIGALIKSKASISGAEVGCQGEVGSASAMAAAAMCAALGGSNAQIENAAEIALEHHLGMTCDPIRGLVQIPCIERNGMGAVKAVAAASLAMHGDGTHKVSLDACIETMRVTGRDMDTRYKETSLGGLSVSVVEC